MFQKIYSFQQNIKKRIPCVVSGFLHLVNPSLSFDVPYIYIIVLQPNISLYIITSIRQHSRDIIIIYIFIYCITVYIPKIILYIILTYSEPVIGQRYSMLLLWYFYNSPIQTPGIWWFRAHVLSPNKDGSEPMFPNKDGSEAMFSVQTRTVDTEKRSDPRGFYRNLCKYSSNCLNLHPEFLYKIF